MSEFREQFAERKLQLEADRHRASLEALGRIDKAIDWMAEPLKAVDEVGYAQVLDRLRDQGTPSCDAVASFLERIALVFK